MINQHTALNCSILSKQVCSNKYFRTVLTKLRVPCTFSSACFASIGIGISIGIGSQLGWSSRARTWARTQSRGRRRRRTGLETGPWCRKKLILKLVFEKTIISWSCAEPSARSSSDNSEIFWWKTCFVSLSGFLVFEIVLAIKATFVEFKTKKEYHLTQVINRVRFINNVWTRNKVALGLKSVSW